MDEDFVMNLSAVAYVLLLIAVIYLAMTGDVEGGGDDA